MAEEHAESFLAQFGKDQKFASIEKTRERVKAERRAGLTPKQRGKKSAAKKQLNTRATDQTHALIAKLVERLDSNITDVIELAVLELAKSKGVQ